MNLSNLWLFLHLLFAFAFVGSLILAEWCGRAARRSTDWKERALLFDIIRRSSGAAGLGPLIMLGVFANLLAVTTGHRMATEVWLRWANGLWLVAVFVMAVLNRPGATRLANIARAAAGGSEPAGYEAALNRWRLANLAQTVLYLAQLALMVFRPRG